MASRAKHAQRSKRSFKQRMQEYQNFLRSGYFYQLAKKRNRRATWRTREK